MSDYLLIYKGKQELDYSPDQLQKRLDEYNQWVNIKVITALNATAPI